MAEYISRGVFRLNTHIGVESHAAVVGKKEGEGPLGKCFDEVTTAARFEAPLSASRADIISPSAIVEQAP